MRTNNIHTFRGSILIRPIGIEILKQFFISQDAKIESHYTIANDEGVQKSETFR